jgi:hypothetical protein
MQNCSEHCILLRNESNCNLPVTTVRFATGLQIIRTQQPTNTEYQQFNITDNNKVAADPVTKRVQSKK